MLASIRGGLPEWLPGISELPIHTNYLLVYVVYRFGWIALLGITLLFAVFSTLGVRKALREKSVLGSIVSLAVISSVKIDFRDKKRKMVLLCAQVWYNKKYCRNQDDMFCSK